MRMAIISDSHGNLTALDAVLADLDAEGPFDAVVVGGDIAYGGPFPRECIERVMQRGLPAVRGNTDEMIISALEGGGDSLGKWVIDQLETYHVDYLKMFSFQYNVETGDGRRLAIVHATPWSIEESVLPESHDREFERMLREADADALAYGAGFAAWHEGERLRESFGPEWDRYLSGVRAGRAGGFGLIVGVGMIGDGSH
jgi:predicted phosphodiesterase